jgi:hypothetical protein
MAKRGLGYYSVFGFEYCLCALPGILLASPLRWMVPSDVRYGTRIIDPATESRARFTNMVAEALALIQTSDPVTFRRVQLRIRTIMSAPGIRGSAYQPLLRLCLVNPGTGAHSEVRSGTVAFLASALVHEATFGHLVGQGVFRTTENFDRFDRICCRQPQRFMQRLGFAKTPWDPDRLSRPGPKHRLTAGLMECAPSRQDAASREGHASPEPQEGV